MLKNSSLYLRGTVVHVFYRDGKAQGFAQMDDGTRMYWHIHNHRQVFPDFTLIPDAVFFEETRSARVMRFDTDPPVTPRFGDRIIAEVEPHIHADRRPWALCWAYLKEWNEVFAAVTHGDIEDEQAERAAVEAAYERSEHPRRPYQLAEEAVIVQILSGSRS